VRESHGHLCGVEIHVVANAQNRCDTLSLKKRVETMRLGKRNLLDVQAETLAACDIGLDHLGILWAPRDFEAAGMHPVEWLAGLLGKVSEGGCRDFDEPHHNLALAHATHHASRTWGGLGSDLMPID
jgi:hypothetical protein